VFIESEINGIISYTTTNSEGKYYLKHNSTDRSLVIKVSFLGYETSSKKIYLKKNQSINFLLFESNEQLKEVFIKSKPIRIVKDTLNYSVSKFTNVEDQVISDVIKKMPGITVQENGQILYQGIPIQKYYIEGLDLLEGRYNLANNNIPVKEVSHVQILENHQPIKLLDSLVFSNRASLNIKLKNKNVFIGTANLGTGVTPFLWETNLTPMLFSGKNQFLFSYQSNNTGNDVANDLTKMTYEEYLSQLKRKIKDKSWVNIIPIPTPPFKKNKWLNNQIQMFTVNHLHKFKNDLEFKSNISYFSDVQEQLGHVKTAIHTLIDTIAIHEVKDNNIIFNSFKSSFILERNVKNTFLKNNFSLNFSKENAIGRLTNNTTKENSKIPFFTLNNSLKKIFSFRKNIITLYSDILYKSSFQKLIIKPGKFNSILNNDLVYETTQQNIKTSVFYTKNYISLTKKIGVFTYIPQVGFETMKEKLDSNILVTDENSSNILTDNFANNITYTNSIFFLNNSLKFRKGIFKSSFDLPIKGINLEKTDSISQNIKQVVFEPSLTLTGEINAYWKASITFNSTKNFGQLEKLYSNYIVENSRNINKYNTEISIISKKKYFISLTYKNPISGFFFYSFINFSNYNSNTMYKYNYSNDGGTLFSSLNLDNEYQTKSINLKGSKFFPNIETSISVFSGWSYSNRNNIINEKINQTNITNYNIGLNIDADLSNRINLEINTNYTLFKTSSKIINSSYRINTLLTDIALNFYINKKNYMSLNSNSYLNSGNKQTHHFLDFKYNLISKKLDYELRWDNILNIKEYNNFHITNTTTVISNYKIRPSQLIFSIKFKF